MALRNVIAIDKERCTGCAECVNACVGGALQLVDGKARLVREDYCDGLGVCVGECPVGALKVEKQEAAEYERRGEGGRGGGGKDSSLKRTLPSASPPANACPGTGPRTLRRKAGEGCPGGAHVQIFPKPDGQVGPAGGAGGPSSLSRWPIQRDLPLAEVIIGLGGDTMSANQHLSVHKEISVRH